MVSEFESFAEHFGVVYDIAEDLLAIETEAAGAALAALRAAFAEALRGFRRSHVALPEEGADSEDVFANGLIDDFEEMVSRLLSGAAPAAGEVARIGFPGQPYGYATGGNEPAPAAPAAPLLDVDLLWRAIAGQDLYHGRYGTVPAGRTTALAIAAAYARLANPEKP